MIVDLPGRGQIPLGDVSRTNRVRPPSATPAEDKEKGNESEPGTKWDDYGATDHGNHNRDRKETETRTDDW